VLVATEFTAPSRVADYKINRIDELLPWNYLQDWSNSQALTFYQIPVQQR
jgi:hypothetical protein